MAGHWRQRAATVRAMRVPMRDDPGSGATVGELFDFMHPAEWNIGEDGLEITGPAGGVLTAAPGDWLIRGEDGEPRCVKPEAFEAAYEPVADPLPPRDLTKRPDRALVAKIAAAGIAPEVAEDMACRVMDAMLALMLDGKTVGLPGMGRLCAPEKPAWTPGSAKVRAVLERRVKLRHPAVIARGEPYDA